MSITDVCICGAPMDAHYNRHGRKTRTCEQARRIVGYAPVNLSQLLRLALEKNTAAQQRAIASIRQVPGGRGYTVRLGGRVKGFRVTGKTYGELVDLVQVYHREKLKQRRLRKAS